MSLNTPRLRTPGRGIAASPHGAGARGGPNQTQLVPTQPPAIPKYSQEELDNDIVNPSTWTYIYERVIVFLSFTAMIIYMAWRWRCFLTRPSTLWISLPLIVSETLLVFPGLFISYFMILHRIHRPMKRLADMKLTPSQLPTVDVFIPCLNEPAEIIKGTLVAASNMDYPKEKLTICVCDDGRRAEIKAVTESVAAECKSRSSQVTIKYIAREKIPGVPHHAKAGNLNNAILGKESNKDGALRNTSGQFLVIFDCDMVCEPHFLNALIPHFYMRTAEGYKVDEGVALVQSPQAFVGVPANDPLGQQYRYFYGPVLEGWDGAGSCPCCGTNVIFQRRCMEAIGGFVYGSVTEDFLTSMYLHDAGFRSKYVHEYLARGLSPDSLSDFMKQRMRWAAGAVEIFFKHNAVWRPGLTWKQTYLYFWSGLQALLAFPALLVCITPFVSLIDNNIQVAPMNANQYSYFMGGFMFFTIWMLIISYRGVPKLYLMRSIQESVFMLNCKLAAVFQVALQGNVKFVTTKKDLVKVSPIRQDIGHIFPHLLYYLMSVIAACLVVYNYQTGKTPHEKLAGEGICFIWIFVVMWQLWPPIGVVMGEIWDEMRNKREPLDDPAPVDPKTAAFPVSTPRLPNEP